MHFTIKNFGKILMVIYIVKKNCKERYIRPKITEFKLKPRKTIIIPLFENANESKSYCFSEIVLGVIKDWDQGYISKRLLQV